MSESLVEKSLIPLESMIYRILLFRGHKVMLDADLARLYNVDTKVLTRAVRRNRKRFPADFMFELTAKEFGILRRHFGTSSWGGRRYKPMVFTEQGVAMLSSVLRSERAILVNIEIMRAFVRLRQVLATHKDIARKLKELEQKYDTHDEKLHEVFEAIAQLIAPLNPKTERQIGFRQSR